MDNWKQVSYNKPIWKMLIEWQTIVSHSELWASVCSRKQEVSCAKISSQVPSCFDRVREDVLLKHNWASAAVQSCHRKFSGNPETESGFLHAYGCNARHFNTTKQIKQIIGLNTTVLWMVIGVKNNTGTFNHNYSNYCKNRIETSTTRTNSTLPVYSLTLS